MVDTKNEKNLTDSQPQIQIQGKGIWQRRYTITLLGFLCNTLIQAQRVNMSISMVAMVNTTSKQPNTVDNNTSECLLPQYEEEFYETSNPEFDWDPVLQGYILSSSYLGNILTQVPGGILAGIFGVKSVLLTSEILASLCNLLSPIAARQHSFLLIAVQLVRGMSQGLVPAAMSLLMAKWFPKHERGFLSAFIYCGFPAGAFIGEVISGALCEMTFDRGWPLVFYSFGLIGFFVSLLTMFFYAETPSEDKRISDSELQFILKYCDNASLQEKRPPTPWRAILTSVPTYVLLVSLFSQYWMSYYFITVHPIYLGSILHIPIKENGILSSGPQLAQMMTGFGSCFFSFWLNRRGKSNIKVIRKGFTTLSSFVFCSGLIGIYLSNCDTLWNEIFLFAAISSIGFSFPGCLISAVDVSPTFCGVLMGFTSSIASLSGFLVPIVVGILTKEEQTMNQWHKIFLISAGVSAFGSLIFLFLGSTDVQPYDPVHSKDANVKNPSTKEEKPTPPEGISTRL